MAGVAVIAVLWLPATLACGRGLWPRAGASDAADGHPASAALGGHGSWRARDAGTQWVVLDLGQVTRLTAVTQQFTTAAPWRLRIEASNSGATASDDEWTLLARHDGAVRAQLYADKVTGSWRYIRLVVTGGGIANSAGLRVAGTPVAAAGDPADPASPTVPGDPAAPLVIVQSCDLWSPRFWRSLARAPDGWRPLIGAYDSASDAVTDAHITQALAAGIAGFQSCWFRQKGNQGQPAMAEYDGAIQSLARTARRRNAVRWSLFWDNSNPAADGIRDAEDFTANITPFWIAAYLTRPNYLTLDGRPVVAFDDAALFARQAGGIEAARAALATFRRQASAAGLPGLLLIANNSGDAGADNARAKAVGFDAVMAYATPVYTGLLRSLAPNDSAVMQAERESWSLWAQHSVLPPILTASVGYDQRPWGEGPMHYLLSPAAWRRIVHDARHAAARLPAGSIGRRLLYLDNWNEFGEGHFIEPSRAFGDAYLKDLLR